MEFLLVALSVYGALILFSIIFFAIYQTTDEGNLRELLLFSFFNVFWWLLKGFSTLIEAFTIKKLKKLYGSEWNKVTSWRTICKKPTYSWQGVSFIDKVTFVLGRKPYTYEQVEEILRIEKKEMGIK